MKLFDRNFPPEKWVILSKDGNSSRALKKIVKEHSKKDGEDYKGWVVVGNLAGLFNVTVGYSLAASLFASDAADGVYVFPESDADGTYRLIVIDDRMLSVDSGFIGDADEVVNEVDQIRGINDLTVFCGDPSLLGRFEDASFISAEDVVNSAKFVEIQGASATTSSGGNLIAIMIAVAVLGGIGYTAKLMFFSSNSTGMSQAQIDAEQRRQFIEAQNKSLSRFLSRRDDWIKNAIETIRHYSVGGYGWVADGGVCDATGVCTMNWHKQGGMAFIEPLAKELGLSKPSLNVERQSLAATVTFNKSDQQDGIDAPLPSTVMDKLSDRSEWTRAWWSFQQRQNLRNPGTLLSTPGQGSPLVDNAPADVPIVYLGRIDAGGLGEASLVYFIDSLKGMDAHVESVSYSPSANDGKNNWKIEVSYVSR